MDDAFRFIRACRREPVDRVPVWLMRQAGRYLPEYRELRKEHSIIEICHSPELAARVTLQPLERFDLDAAILFADILLPLEGFGIDFEFASGEGPVIANPIRSPEDIDALQGFDPERKLGYVGDAVREIREALAGRVPLIGFAAAPFTLASYMVEGGSSRRYLYVKSLMYTHPQAWERLMRVVREVTRDYLAAQIEAGAQAVQLFDSWAGCLSPVDYREFVLPHSSWVLEGLNAYGVPRIHFGTDTATLLGAMKEAGGEVIGVDWRIPIDQARRVIGPDFAVQGNLDPAALFAPKPALAARVNEILSAADAMRGFIFNLGHGVWPETPPDAVQTVVETVHAFQTPSDRRGGD